MTQQTSEMNFEQVQAKIRARCAKEEESKTPRRLEWQRISPQVLRADDYEIHRKLEGGILQYRLFKLPFHEELWVCGTAEEAKEQAQLHQVLK
jgi:hypothetical protein